MSIQNTVVKYNTNIFYFIAIFFITFIVLIPFHFGDFPNFEGWNTAIFSNVAFAEALFSGEYLVWTDKLGLGMPMPVNPNQIHHPLVLLFGLTSPSIAISVFYQVQMSIGAIAFWLLSQHYEVSKRISLVCVITYLTCSTSADWIFLKFLPSEMFFWSMTPVVFLLMSKLLDSQVETNKIILSLGVGLSFGFTVLNSHPTFSVLLALSLIVFILINWKRALGGYKWILLSGMVTFLISSAKIFMIFNEYALFSDALGRNSARLVSDYDWLTTSFVHSLFLKPVFIPYFSEVKEAILNLNIVQFLGSINSTVNSNGIVDFLGKSYWHPYLGSNLQERDVFMGPVFVVIALISPLIAIILRNREVLIIATTAVVFFMLIFLVPDQVLYFIGRDVFFRDGFFIFGIVVVGMILTQWLKSKKKTVKNIVKGIIFVQLVSIIGVSIPTWTENLTQHRPYDFKQISSVSFRDPWQSLSIIEKLHKLGVSERDRIYFGPVAQNLLPSNLYGSHSHVWAFHNLRQVNAAPKGIHLNSIYSHNITMEGRIDGHNVIVNDSNTLDVLSIKYVVVAGRGGVAIGLKFIGEIYNNEEQVFSIYYNPTFWPEAVGLSSNILNVNLNKKVDCKNSGLLCKNFDPIVRLVSKDVGIKLNNNGVINIKLHKNYRGDMLMISKMFRPEWSATSNGKPLEIHKLFGGLIGVSTPKGVDNINLKYTPIGLYSSVIISYLTIILSIFGIMYIQNNKIRNST